MSDFRVPMEAITNAFGVAVTVTRPAPNNTPVMTTGIWHDPAAEPEPPHGRGMQRREPRKVMSIPSASLPVLPAQSLVMAPEASGGVQKTWRVDGYDRVEPDLYRVFLTAVA